MRGISVSLGAVSSPVVRPRKAGRGKQRPLRKRPLQRTRGFRS